MTIYQHVKSGVHDAIRFVFIFFLFSWMTCIVPSFRLYAGAVRGGYDESNYDANWLLVYVGGCDTVMSKAPKMLTRLRENLIPI